MTDMGVSVLNEASTVKELINLLMLFNDDVKVCGIGGGPITITQDDKYPNTLWFE